MDRTAITFAELHDIVAVALRALAAFIRTRAPRAVRPIEATAS